MTFDNLVFITHPATDKGIMAKVRLDNGKILSVIAGEGFYSISKKNGIKGEVTSVEDALDFEVMFDGEVMGWQSREDITEIMNW